MTTDKSYSPIGAEFEHVVEAYYGPTLTHEQIQSLKVMFFAGAAAVYEIMTKTPDRIETMKEEILDHADRWQQSA